jgi:hypothetical protein
MGFTHRRDLPEVTDRELEEALRTVEPCTVVVLRPGPRYEPPGPDRSPTVAATIWEHGKRNYALHRAGLMPIVCPVGDGSDIAGVGIFEAPLDEVEAIMAEDPAVRSDVLTFDAHATASFPGSRLGASGR